MNKDEIMKKYLNGETSLQEEKELFENSGKESDPWVGFVSRNNQTPPEGLEDIIWNKIQSERRQKQRFLYGLTAAVASVVLVLGFIFFPNGNDPEMTLSEKEQMLQEALSMFPAEETDKEILYSDELIEIYVATN